MWACWTLLVIAWTPAVALVWLATAAVDPGRRAAGRVFRTCAAVATRVNPFWTTRILGRPPARSEHPFIVVCNHESLADVVILGSLPWEMKWLSKESNFRLPFLGWMMRMAGDLRVRRADPDSRAQAYDELKRWLARGVSVMIFPEGTRSTTPELLPFRNGAFRLAIETGCPLLPLAVSGTRHSIHKGSLRFSRARITVRILEPVPTSGLEAEDIESLRDRVRERIDAARRLGEGTA